MTRRCSTQRRWGRKSASQVNYKQRDTRPRDDGVYPTTGWNHNWYSYVHFDIPVGGGSRSGQYEQRGGAHVRAGGQNPGELGVDQRLQDWEAILYAPDNSESYYSAGRHGGPAEPADAGAAVRRLGQDQRVPGGAWGRVAGHLQPGAAVGTPSYGIVERYGCVFDKGGLTNGMAGVWQLDLRGRTRPTRGGRMGTTRPRTRSANAVDAAPG